MSQYGLHNLQARISAIRAATPSRPRPSVDQTTAPSSTAFSDALAQEMGATAGTGMPGAPQAFAGAGMAGYMGAPTGYGMPGYGLPGGYGMPGGVGGVGGYGGVANAYGVGGVTGMPAGGWPSVTAVDTGQVQLDRSGPPPELAAYGNGRIPPEALAPLGVGDHRMWAPAARAFQAMMAAAAQDGVTIGVSSSYRSYEDQVRMVERYGLYSQGGRAAAPGTSNHGWGLSVDLRLDSQAQAWMRANAQRFGFVEDVAREPWHWTFKASGPVV